MISIRPVRVVRWLGVLAFAPSLFAALPLPAQTSAEVDSNQTVAVLYFTNSALVRNSDYAPLSKGIADMLITQLAENAAIRVVERDQLQRVLEEQNLGATDRVDKETAVRVGRIVGARHMLMGVFAIDPKERMRIDLRAVNAETSEIEYVESVSGRAENVFDLIAELGRKVNAGLRFPPMPASTRPARGSTSAADQYRAFYLVSRSIEEQDRKNVGAAVALLREAIDVYPEYTRARVRLAVLEKRAAGANP